VYTRRSFIHKGLEALACITFNALPPQSTPKPLHIFISDVSVKLTGSDTWMKAQ